MTQWYRAGTASLVNGTKAVTGTLTAWQVGAVVGDAFSIDGTTSYAAMSAVWS